MSAGSATTAPALACERLSKSFGSNRAVSGVDLSLAPGEIRGLVGHNGAGKSTLMRMLGGLLAPDDGAVAVGGRRLERLDPRRARTAGIRIVQQELALCPVLQVGEAGVLQAPGVARGLRWRRNANRRVRERIEEIFPGVAVPPERSVASLSIGLRQVVEIATALLVAPGERLACVILDEPTSSLDGGSVEALYGWLRRRAEAEGFAVVVSTHKLDEVFRWHDRVSVMTDGEVVGDAAVAETTRDQLVALMQRPAEAQAGGSAAAPRDRIAMPARRGGVRIRGLRRAGLRGIDLDVGPGEIVGLGGLEGQGQDAILAAVIAACGPLGRLRGNAVQVDGRLSIVSGDRREEGIFPLWDVEHNVSVSALGSLGRLGFVSPGREHALAAHWLGALRVKGAAADPITSLSGGTQQKLLLARALATESAVLLLKDPTRGVDEATKLEIYDLLEQEREAGAAIFWYSTESRELQRCDRVHVIQGGRIAATLEGAEMDERAIEERIVSASFA